MRAPTRRASRTTLSAVLATALLGGTVAATAAPASAGSTPAAPALRLSAATQGLPSDWVARGSGYFTTNDASDMLHYQVVTAGSGVPSDEVRFKLQAFDRSIAWKTLVMPNGLGSRWDISIDPYWGRYTAQNSLWAHEVDNGQSLELWKSGFLNTGRRVLYIGDLAALPGGSLVTFTWLDDD